MNNQNFTVFNFSKNVSLLCHLTLGEKCYTDVGGYKTKGKVATITDMKPHSNCESGILVKIDIYQNYIDSNWIQKIDNK